ncbi:MFS transporter [Kutzneria sp. NPDC052558]|uniref:MFS transporter n=1 Tax=Kutzneria sp. NPDC052558 TaxID=3364121 RepID=UPI0037C81BF8
MISCEPLSVDAPGSSRHLPVRDEADVLAAVGYLVKDSPRAVLVDGVRATARGETVLSPTVASTLVNRMWRPTARWRTPVARWEDRLTPSRSGGSMPGSVRSLREPVFRRWFLGQVLSASGGTTQAVALAWLVVQLTGSGLDIGLMTSCSFLPLFLLGPYAGGLVDRIGPRRVLIATQSLLAVLAGLLAVLAATGTVQMWMLFVIAAASGSVSTYDGTARQVYVVDLVGAERVSNAVALNEVVVNGSRVLGPAVGGAALGIWGAAACCAVNGLSFLPSLIVVVRHRVEASAHPPRPARDGGLRYAWRNPAIRACLLLAAASGMVFHLDVPIPLLAYGVFRLDGTAFGLMMAAFGVGSIPGVLLAASGPSRPSGLRVAILAGATGIAVLGASYAPTVPLVFLGMAVTGCLSIWFISLANTLVQLESDPGMRGRVNAAWTMALPGCILVTGPFMGWVAGVAGPRLGFGVAGLAMLLAAAVGWRALTRARLPVGQ